MSPKIDAPGELRVEVDNRRLTVVLYFCPSLSAGTRYRERHAVTRLKVVATGIISTRDG